MPADKPDTKKPWLVDGEVLDDWTSRWVHPSRLDYNGSVALDRLIRAAPALARALCLLEAVPVSGDDVDWGPAQNWRRCLCCGQRAFLHVVHKPDCPLDAALTAAGLTAEDREEVRRGS